MSFILNVREMLEKYKKLRMDIKVNGHTQFFWNIS